MQLCSLSVAFACPYHNHTAPMGNPVHNVDISKLLAYTTPYTQPAICPVQLKPGFIHEEHTSPVCQWPSKVTTEVGYFVVQTQFHQLSGWLVSDDPAGEEAGCGGPELARLHVVCGCKGGWTYCQIL